MDLYLILLIALIVLVVFGLVITFVIIKGLKKSNREYFNYILEYQNRDFKQFSSSLNTLGNNMAVLYNQSEMLRQIAQESENKQENSMHQQNKNIQEGLDKLNQHLFNQYQVLDRKQNDTIKQISESLDSLKESTQSSLDKIRATVDEKLNETLQKRLNESFSIISKQLEAVYVSLGEMQQLSGGMDDLKKILSNVKTRGIWGEMQLSAIISQVMAKSQYEENCKINPNSQERVEFALKLPQGKNEDIVYLAIDSKFPQDVYTKLIDAYNSNDKVLIAENQKNFANAIKAQAKLISQKYIVPPYSTDFAIMFLPIEGLYNEVAKQTELLETLHTKYRVMLAGPTTLIAMLNSLQLGFKSIAIAKHSQQLRALLDNIKADFESFSRLLEQTQQRLRQASESIDTAFNRSKKIERQLQSAQYLEQ